MIYIENNLAIFSVSNIGNKWKQKTRQNSPKFFTAKNVIIVNTIKFGRYDEHSDYWADTRND